MTLVSFRLFRKIWATCKNFLGKWFTAPPTPPPPRQKNARTPMRMVPPKCKGFCARLGPHGKRSLQGLLESTKKNMGSQASFRDN